MHIQLMIPGLEPATIRQAGSWLLATTRARPHTIKMHADHVRYLAEFFGTKTLDKIDYTDLVDYMRHEQRRGLSDETIRKRLSTMKLLFAEAMYHRVVKDIPRIPFIRQRTVRRERFWTREHLNLAVAETDLSDPDFSAFLVVSFETGQRTSDINRFRWGDVKLHERAYLRRGTKTGTEPAWVPMTNAFHDYLTRRFEAVQPSYFHLVCGRNHGNPNRAIKALARVLGLPECRPSEVGRHSKEAAMIEAGVDPQAQRFILGLKNERTLQVYKHATDNLLREAVSRLNQATA